LVAALSRIDRQLVGVVTGRVQAGVAEGSAFAIVVAKHAEGVGAGSLALGGAHSVAKSSPSRPKITSASACASVPFMGYFWQTPSMEVWRAPPSKAIPVMRRLRTTAQNLP